MTFDELWKEVEKLKVLPDMAIQQIPSALKPDTKRRLQGKTVIEIAKIVEAAVEDVNHGSVELLDALIRKRL